MRSVEDGPSFAPKKGAEGGLEHEPVDAVRIIPLTFQSIGTLREEFAFGRSIDEIEFTRVILTLKSRMSDSSYGLMVPLGGKMEPGETPLVTARRKLRQRSLLYPMGGHWWEDNPLFQPIEGDYTYLILGREETREAPKEPRRVNFLTYPVLPPEYTRKEPRHPEISKIASIESFTPEEFRLLIDYGELSRIRDETGPLGSLDDPFQSFDVAGSITKAHKYDIDIDAENRGKKGALLDSLIDRVDEFEVMTKSTVLSEVNTERARRGVPRAEALSQTNRNKQKVITNDEIIRAFERVQLFWYLRDERKREKMGERRPPPGMDLLKFAWYMAGEGIEAGDLGSLLFEAPTKHIRRNIRMFVLSLRESFVKVEIEEIRDGLREGESLTGKDSIKKKLTLETIQGKLTGMTPLERAEYIGRLEEFFVPAYARHMGVSVQSIERARVRIDSRFQRIIEQSLQVPTDYRRIFQPNKLLNEVVNAPLARLTLLALGVNPYAPDERIADDRLMRQLGYEPMRHLAYIAHAIPVYERYLEQLENGNEPIEAIFNGEIFTLPHHEERRERGERLYKLTHRSTRFDVLGRKRHIVVDAKPPKDFDSLLRKSFYEPLVEIHDIFSRNIVLVEDNENEEASGEAIPLDRFQKISQERIAAAKEMAGAIKARFRDACAGKGWTIEFFDEENTYARLNMSPAELKEEIQRRRVFGKRPGSMAPNIIRETFTLILKDPDGREYDEEVIIYPFDNFKDTPYEGILWGHEEKIEDDAVGGYKARRLMNPTPDFPDLPSFYIMTNPPHIYPLEAEAIYFSKEGEDGDLSE